MDVLHMQDPVTGIVIMALALSLRLILGSSPWIVGARNVLMTMGK